MLPPAVTCYMSLLYCYCVTALYAAALFAAALCRVSVINDRVEKKFRLIFSWQYLQGRLPAHWGSHGRLGKTPSVRPIERRCRALLSVLAGHGPVGLSGLGKAGLHCCLA
jgi:hypothetical protein